MRRNRLKDLIAWKNQAQRMPLLLDGARQVGKSYLLEKLFGDQYFQQVIKLDFLANPSLCQVFADSKNPADILTQIQIVLGVDIDPGTDLIIFDEIGECQNALDSLKFFQEQRPEMFICASGSNLGLLTSFPVGKVDELHLYPMSFEEFIIAHGNTHLTEAFQTCVRNDTVHAKLWSLLLDYYFVGGMPKPVHTWVNGDKSKINALSMRVRKVQRSLINGYIRDFGKYVSLKSTALHIERVFNNIPMQLMKEINGSVNRYKFSKVIPKKNGYRDLEGPIEYLVKTRLVSKNYIIQGKPRSPLKTQIMESRFKLFLHDVGLLHCLADVGYQEIQLQNFEFKGYIAENFVQNEVLSLGLNQTYSWHSQHHAELEFIFTRPDGEIIPVEVKSGQRTQAKSLKSYIERYNPKQSYKFTANIGGFRDSNLQTLPIYYAANYINRLIYNELE
ncbi:MAG: ATP-binding protein [Xanthomonadales bacterium]|nr:ATP-binding protein [Xanthomonadales bacterium]